jgi:hypothetical protein
MADKQATLQRLSDFAGTPDEEQPVSIAAILNREVTIFDVEFHSGEFGEFVTFRCSDTRKKDYLVKCGGQAVVEALGKAFEANALPLLATFRMEGRRVAFR